MHAADAQGYEDARDYEESLDWLELYTQEDLDFVNANVDPVLFSGWGFTRVWSVNATLSNDTGVGRRRWRRRATSLDEASWLAPRDLAERGERDARHKVAAARVRRPAAEVWADPQRVRWHMRMLTALDAD